MNLKDQILAANDKPIEKLFVPEWNLDVYIQVISAGERLAIEDAYNSKREKDIMSLTVAYCLCDENGNRIFDPKKDISLLSQKSANALLTIFKAASKLNKMREDDVDELEKK